MENSNCLVVLFFSHHQFVSELRESKQNRTFDTTSLKTDLL